MLLYGCGGDSNSATPTQDQGRVDMTPDMGEDATPGDPFEVWREMRDTLRDDPNYLRYERDRLVEEGDPAAMHEFVRDRIRTVPTRFDGWGPANELLYGPRAALRYGEGSMRDKAEILHQMFIDAGFEAQVRQLTTPPANFTDEVLRARDWVEPTISTAQTERWSRVLDVRESAPLLDPNGTQAMALAERIVDALPADTPFLDFDPANIGQIPIVQFRESPEAEWTLANLFMPGVELGESPSDPFTAGAFAPVEAPPIIIEIRLHTTSGPLDGEVLVTGSFPQSVLAGRQLTIAAAPAGELEDTLLQPIDHFTTYIPIISLQGIDVDEETRDEYTFVGEAFTLRGNRITVNEEGNVTVDGRAIASPDDVDLSTIDMVEAAAEASKFPEVTLRVDVTSNGNDVERLPASAFEIQDNGEQAAPVLLANEKRPRIVFVTDRSGSVPAEFRSTEFTDLLVGIAGTLQTANPRAEFINLQVGSLPDASMWTSDLTVLETQLNTTRTEGSDLWNALSATAQLQPTMCVMVTDGEAIDMPDPVDVAWIDRAPPCIFLRAGGDPMLSVLPELAEAVDGEVYEVSDIETANARILEYVSERTQTYRLRYTSRDRTPAEHTVTVKVGAVETTTTYDAPETEDDGQIWGLQMVMSQGRIRPPTRRMLAGEYFGEAMSIEEAQRELITARTVAFEGSSPIPHEFYDEVLENRLGAEPLVRAVQGGDEDEMLTELAEGRRHVPVELLGLMAPEFSEAPTFTGGLKAAMLEERLIGPRSKESAVDLLLGPGFGTRAVSDDPLVDTIAATIRASLVEELLYETTTVSLLEGEELTYLANAAELDTLFASLSEEDRMRWRLAITPYDVRAYHLVVPVDGDPVAFYAVDKLSGHAAGVLADGSGGGRTATELRAQLAEVEAFLSWLGFGGNAASASLPFGIWVAFSKAYAKNILIATIAIVEMSSPVTDLPGDARDIGCGAIEDAAAGAIGGPVGYTIGVINSGVAAATGSSLINCGDF